MAGFLIIKTPRIKTSGLIFTLVLLAGGVAFGQQAGLQAKLDKLLRHKDVYPWKVSVLAAELKSGQTIFSSRSTRPLIPASNMKLVVTAAAVSRWGANYEFVTLLGRKGKDVVVIGSGDPGFAGPAMQITYNQDPTTVFRDWAGKVKRAGLREVSNVIVDDSIFDKQFHHPNWPSKQLNRSYTPPVAGLSLWRNLVTVKKTKRDSRGVLELLVEPGISYRPKDKEVPDSRRQVWISGGPGAKAGYAGGVQSSVGVADPSVFFGCVFRAVLAKEGVSVRGQVVRQRLSDAEGKLDEQVVILAQASTKLTDIIRRANTWSRTLFAECLLKRLGVAPGQQGSWASGSTAVGKFLTDRVRAGADQFVIDDGSGLSRKNRVSPAALVAVLQYMHGRSDAKAFRESLAVWGRSGTLSKRSNKSVLAGRVFAKTGYIRGVRSLSGYIQTKRGNWIGFSILMNEVPGGHGWRARQLQEDICQLLVDY